MTFGPRIHTSPTAPGGSSRSLTGSTTRSSIHGRGRPAERRRCSRGPSGSWSSGSSWTTPPVVSVSPYTPNSGQPKVRNAALSTGVVIGEAP